jgi:hypothetical protein
MTRLQSRSRKRSPIRRSRLRKRSQSRSRTKSRKQLKSRSRKRSGKKSLTLAEQRKRGIIPPLPGRLPNGRSRRRRLSPSKKRELARKRKLGLIPRRTKSKYRGPPLPKRKLPTNRSPKQLGHGVSTEWVKDTFIVKIKRKDGSVIKFIPPFAAMTGISKITGKPTTRRLGLDDLESLTKEQRAILGRY